MLNRRNSEIEEILTREMVRHPVAWPPGEALCLKRRRCDHVEHGRIYSNDPYDGCRVHQNGTVHVFPNVDQMIRAGWVIA